MLQALAELLRALVKPESDWGKFSRKIIGLLVSASIRPTIWNVYFNYQLNRNAAEVSVGEVIERDPNKETVIKELLERIKGSNRESSLSGYMARCSQPYPHHVCRGFS